MKVTQDVGADPGFLPGGKCRVGVGNRLKQEARLK